MLYDTTGENTSRNSCLILKGSKISHVFSIIYINQAQEKHNIIAKGDSGLTQNKSRLPIDGWKQLEQSENFTHHDPPKYPL